jgi:HEAT repeat protein
MTQTPAASTESASKRRQGATFVAELIIFRRHLQHYPANHPSVTTALNKTLASFTLLIADGRGFTLGVGRQGLLLQNEPLGADISKFREFAGTLSSFGVITITFGAGLQPEELHAFNSIINLPRNEVWESGGIRRVFENSGIHSIKIQVIDPSVFTLTDEIGAAYTVDPWEIFVRKLLDGYFSVSQERLLQLFSAPPAELAGEFGAIIAGIPEEVHQQSIRNLADFFVSLAERQGIVGLQDDLLDKIASFIAGIPANLRYDFILNICKSSETATGFSEELLQRIPGDAFMEAMNSVATHGGNIPEMLLKLMQRLSLQTGSTPDLDAAIAAPGTAEKVRVLFRESAVEEFVPPAYQKALMEILATDTLPAESMHALDELNKTLEYDHLEYKIGDIISEIIREIPAGERGDGIRSNLMGLASHYLMKGDFNSLERTCRIILEEMDEMQSAALFDPGFIQEILDAASVLGRDKFQDIRSIICTVGHPFVIPLMERLFAEENRSLRRLWFDCLSDLGEMVRSAALERLNDERWFVVRNLIIMLRAFNDQEVQRQVRRLVNHPNPRVCKEAMKSLLSYGDPMVDKLLLKDLEGDELGRKLVAVQVAEMSNNPKVVDNLLAIIESGSIREYGLELKISAVQALAAIGNPQALPKLKEILSTVRLLHPGKHAQLKTAIIRALPRFPSDLSRPLLEEIAATGGKTLGPIAYEALKGLHGDAP